MGRKTALFEEHKKLGANFIDFAGWELPVYYSTPIKEHLAVRNAAGLFDVSHMGEIFVEGKDAAGLVQLLVTRDIGKLQHKQMFLTAMCNEDGGIIDDLTIYKFSEEKFMLVVNAGCREKDFRWIKKHAEKFDCSVRDASNETAKLDLQGPAAQQILQKLTGFDLREIKFYQFDEFEISGIKCIASRSGYTGEDGFEIYLNASKAALLWNALLEAGKEFGLLPCGLAARDMLRLECCMALYGHEIDEQHSPLQGSYEWAVDFEKGEFIGRGALLKQKKEGIAEKLVAFEMLGREIPRHGYKIFKDGKGIGIVTSGGYSPSLKKNIGMGYVRERFSSIGEKICIEIRGNKADALIVKKPFYKRKNGV